MADTVSGTVTGSGSSGGLPAQADVDVLMMFPANDAGAPASEALTAQNVDLSPGCQ
jgi:hypothetical protein